MYRKSLEQELDRMSYEQQKELLRHIEDDNQAYDDSCNVIEVTVEAIVNVVSFLLKKLF